MNNAGWGIVPGGPGAARESAAGHGKDKMSRVVRTATMTTSRRVGRWALIVLTVLVAGWVLLRVGVGVYLRTPAGRAVVAHQLQEVIGLPVEVSEVDLGSRSSSLKFR